MVSSDGERQSSPLRGEFDALGDGLTERRQPLAHSRARHFDLAVLAGVEITQPLNPSVQHLDLAGDAKGDFSPLAFFLGSHQLRSGGDQGARLLREPQRLDGRRHAARYNFRQRLASILADA